MATAETTVLPEMVQISADVLKKVLDELSESTKVNKALNESILLLMQTKTSRPSGNISDISFSSLSSSEPIQNLPKPVNGNMLFMGNSLLPMTLAYQQKLIANHKIWREKKTSDLEEVLSNPLYFVTHCKQFKSLDEMRTILNKDQLLDDIDADNFTGLIRNLKSKEKSEERTQWNSFLRAVCRPYFNPQEPEITGENLGDYENRVRLFAEKIMEYIFVKTSFTYRADASFGRRQVTWTNNLTITDIRQEIRRIHHNKADNEVRYLKEILSAEYPTLKLARRNKRQKLSDLIALCFSTSASTSACTNGEHSDESDLDASGCSGAGSSKNVGVAKKLKVVAKKAVPKGKSSVSKTDKTITSSEEEDEDDLEIDQAETIALAMRRTVGGKTPRMTFAVCKDGSHILTSDDRQPMTSNSSTPVSRLGQLEITSTSSFSSRDSVGGGAGSNNCSSGSSSSRDVMTASRRDMSDDEDDERLEIPSEDEGPNEVEESSVVRTDRELIETSQQEQPVSDEDEVFKAQSHSKDKTGGKKGKKAAGGGKKAKKVAAVVLNAVVETVGKSKRLAATKAVVRMLEKPMTKKQRQDSVALPVGAVTYIPDLLQGSSRRSSGLVNK